MKLEAQIIPDIWCFHLNVRIAVGRDRLATLAGIGLAIPFPCVFGRWAFDRLFPRWRRK